MVMDYLIGTCGYAYPQWKGVFYPQGTKEEDFLTFYASRFPAVEVDSTFYRMNGLGYSLADGDSEFFEFVLFALIRPDLCHLRTFRIIGECICKHFLNGGNRMESDILFDFLIQFVQVTLVEFRIQDRFDFVPFRGEDFFLQPTDGHHFSFQRQLSGHREIRRFRLPGDQRIQRHRHRDARRRTVFGRRAFRNMCRRTAGR